MKLYLAAMFNTNMEIGGAAFQRLTPIQQQHRREVKYLLESYHYVNTDKGMQRIRDSGERIFLDSGAFSAYTKGVTIDLPQYCEFIKRHPDVIEYASVLDAVGDPLKTWQNQQWMEQLGTNPLPCFHYGEDERYLEHYISKYEYITLGGMVPISTPQLLLWLDRLWEKYLCDSTGRPRLKVHGFGLTTVKLMERYPWYSVDSSSWLQISSFGNILHPDLGIICFSSNSPNRKQEGKHFDTFSPVEQHALAVQFWNEGYTVDEFRTSYMARRCYCMKSFAELNRRFDSHGQKFVNDQMGLF